ncbi:MAG: type I restriction endonuclease subunit R [Phycisphaerales bacterium]
MQSSRSQVGPSERTTQDRVKALFQHELGYRYLGDWKDRPANRNVEVELLRSWLAERGVERRKAERAIELLQREADRSGLSLYDHNHAMYQLLRYGVPVKVDASEHYETVPLIDWNAPENNDFAIAEEVTLDAAAHGRDGHKRRPDIVLYVNGIAVATLELKRSRTSVAEGIRQTISNQSPEFNQWFYSTVQLVFAGNDTEGLRYATTGTPEKYWLAWKEDVDDANRLSLDKYLLRMCRKDRLVELMRDFIVFDGGVKKVPRPHQYFGVKAAQDHVARREGGIIWHTQGSGKSIVMVLLARWILENNPHARVAVITDRDELDKQIEGVFRSTQQQVERATSGRDLMDKLRQPRYRLLTSLVHKFGRQADKGGKDDDKSFKQMLEGVKAAGPVAEGEVFLFVDECHRTHGLKPGDNKRGRLHQLMKAMLPKAVFVGFTGTPLLRADRATSREVFGRYIHTYKFNEAVEDGVVLDLLYEARDVDQKLDSEERADAWFDAKTRGLSDWKKRELQTKWGTMKKVYSSRSRLERVVDDIVFDFATRPRLEPRRGNAILVASSILEACRYYKLFQQTELRSACALITSYDPNPSHVSTEDTGAENDTDKRIIYDTYQALLEPVAAAPGKTRTETYEDQAKKRFIEDPANMRLLIVVDKLLTGFDAPPCTYLYIDKTMKDHGLFQAICRTNRLDGDDKPFGTIVDYRDLFTSVNEAIAVYTAELDTGDDDDEAGDPEILLHQRLQKGKERLDQTLEQAHLLCEPVPPPRGDLEFIRYFCGNTDVEEDIAEREPLRAALYKAVVDCVRAYASISDDMAEAGYSASDQARIRRDLDRFARIRDVVRMAAGEVFDPKAYEPDMRHLIDTYLAAEQSRKVSDFDEIPLVELIVNTGIGQAIAERLGGLGDNKDAVAETIEHNVRKKIVKERLTDPAYFERMSRLLDELIRLRREKAIQYAEYLREMAELARRVQRGYADDTPEPLQANPAVRAIHNTLEAELGDDGQDTIELATKIDAAVRGAKGDGFRNNPVRQRQIKAALMPLLGDDQERVERLYRVIEAQEGY